MGASLYGMTLERKHASELDNSMISLEHALQLKWLVHLHFELLTIHMPFFRYQLLHGCSKIVDTTILK